MKNKYILFSTAAVLLMGLAAFTFAGTNGDDDKKKIEKKIEISIENGNKTVTVTTTEDGKTKKEIFTGKEADEYLEKNNHGSFDEEIKSEGSPKRMMKIKTDADATGEKNSEANIFMFCNMGDTAFNCADMKEEMEKLKKELKESGINFEFEAEITEECKKNMHHAMTYAYSFDTDDIEKDIDSIIKSIDIDVNISSGNGNQKQVIIKKIVITDDKKNNQTKMKKEAVKEEVKLYPNPADDTFMIEFDLPSEEKAIISATDINGKVVFTETISGSKKYKKQVNTSEFADGTYILDIKQGDTHITKKVVIK